MSTSNYYLTGAALSPNMYGYGQYGNYWGAYYGVLSPYGTLRLTNPQPAPQQSSPVAGSSGSPFVEPLTIREMRSYLKIPARTPEDTDEDNELLSLIVAAREQAELLQGRDIIQKQWDLTFDYWTSYRIGTRAPLQSVDLFQYTTCDGATIELNEGTDFLTDKQKEPGFVFPPYNGTWPTFTPQPSGGILMRFTSGYALDDPWWYSSGQRIKNGMKMLISSWFNNRMPFEKGLAATAEYPYAVTSCLTYGSLVRVR